MKPQRSVFRFFGYSKRSKENNRLTFANSESMYYEVARIFPYSKDNNTQPSQFERRKNESNSMCNVGLEYIPIGLL